MSPTYDVIVVGLGGMGSAAAYRLAARGRTVLGLDRYDPAHTHGSSHGESRIVRQAYSTDPSYVPLLLRSYELWERLEHDSGRDLLTVTGGLLLGSPTSLTIAGSGRSARQWDLAHEMLDAREIRHRFPTMTPARDTVGFYEENAGFVRPEAGVSAHLGLARHHGAELRFREPVTGWLADESGDGVTVWTASGTHYASRLVICPGAWTQDVLPDLGFTFRAERYVQYWFDPVGSIASYRPDRHPVYIWEAGDGRLFYGFPALGGRQEGVKISFLRDGRSVTPDTVDREVRPAEVEVTRGYLRPRIPSLPGGLRRAATCIYTHLPEEHFVVASHPRLPQVTVGCGGSGHGFKFVPVVGEILSELVVDGASRHPVEPFDPGRLTTTTASTAPPDPAQV